MTYDKQANRWHKIEANGLLNNVIATFAYVGDEMTSPQRKIVRIVKSHTNGSYPIPVSWLELECGHTHRSLLLSKEFDLAHRDDNHIAGLGATLGCVPCAHYRDALARLSALSPAQVSHTRFRHHDSRGFGPGSIYVYAPDVNSPTGCHLLFSIDDTPDVQAILSKLRSAPLSPTERR